MRTLRRLTVLALLLCSARSADALTDTATVPISRLTPSITCKPRICREAEEHLGRGEFEQAADDYDYIVTSVDTPSKELLYFLLATLKERLKRPDEAIRDLVRYRDYTRDTPDERLPEGQRRPDVDELEKRLLGELDLRRSSSLSAGSPAPQLAPWRVGLGAASLTLGLAGMISGGVLAGLAGHCLDLSNSCTEHLAENSNRIIGATLMVGGVATVVAGVLLIKLPAHRKPAKNSGLQHEP